MSLKTDSMTSMTDDRIVEIIINNLNHFKNKLINELQKETRNQTKEIMNEQINKIIQLEFTVSIFQNHVNVLK